MLRVKPDISVIVCCHTKEFIFDFVRSVKRSLGVNYEIIVISSDEDLCLTGISGCTVFNGPQLPAAKRNMGSRIANGKYLAFFDDDVEISSDCLKRFKDCMDKTHAGMVYGKLRKADEPERFDEAGGFLTWTGFIWSRAGQNIFDEGQYDKTEPIFSGKSASCIIEKRLFNKIGGFDEDFGILGEESDLAWRVWLSGREVLFCPEATGIHWFNCKRKDVKVHYTSTRVHRNGSRNYCVMLIKNLEALNLCRILPFHVIIWAMAGLLMLVTGKFTQAINIFKGLWYVPTNLTHILRKRRKVQSERIKSDSELIPTIFRSPGRSYYTERFKRYIAIGLHG